MSPAQAKAIPQAVAHLIELVADDEQQPQGIKMIKVEKFRTIGSNNNWSISAVLDDGSSYIYAVYIDENGRMETDGF